ncbi:MAG: hypothetical protein ACI8RC_002800 [Ilumatobacter sp.]|jgi:hypothetical protein
MRRRPSRRTVAASALLALGVTAAGCASSDTKPAALVEAESNAVLSGDGPQYGDSLDEWHAADETSAKRPATETRPGFDAVEWEDLIPPGFSSDQILARYEDRLTAAEPGSTELDDLYAEMNAEFDDVSVNPQLNSVDIQLAGFVAPLTYDGDDITEFLLVPYFGACIHVPPPPVNQTVIVTLEEGDSLTLEESWGAVWVAGNMTVTPTDTDLATAGYSISAAQFGVYESQ